ncbi:DUF4166 domain-containing protein [Microbacterium sp. 179-B 1A2 NHS]|uniref:DUF4166 domain-containing protein n=1 Tax=Microbacterium sp. 179-B 1A2 NHS TaxID=3142383 RepID=UPI0039A314BF
MRRYFGPVPEGCVGVGEGVYGVAGSRLGRWAGPALAWSARRGVLFPESGRDVPFVVENTPDPSGALRGARWFAFPGVTRVMIDEGSFTYRIVSADGSGLPVSAAVPRLSSWLTENGPTRHSPTRAPKRSA